MVAIAAICVAGMLLVTMNVFLKDLSGQYSIVQILWARYFFHVLLITIIFPMKAASIFRVNQLGLHIRRSFLLMAATSLNVFALALMPLADVAAITFMSPIFVAAFAMMMLSEKVDFLRWGLILLGFAGALLVVQPHTGDMNGGAVFALLCAITYAFYQVSTRMVRDTDPVVSLIYGGLFGMVAFSAMLPFFFQAVPITIWLQLILIGALGACAHLLIIMALQRAEASRVSPFIYLQLVWAMIAGFLIFGDIPSIATITGATIICVCGLILARMNVSKNA